MVKYNAKQHPKKIQSRIDRRKRNRYHNDAALFPDTNDTSKK